MKKLVKALNKSAEFCRNRKELAIGITSKIFNIDEDYFRSSWDEYKFDVFLDQALMIALDDIARWVIENKMVDDKEIPNFFNHMCPDVLNSVFPQKVSIIQ